MQIILGCHKRKILSNMGFDKIRINNIDGFCSKIRARVGCFVRKTRNFPKKRKQISDLLHITQANHNLIEHKHGETPAIKEGLTDKVWTWNDILNVRLSIKI